MNEGENDGSARRQQELGATLQELTNAVKQIFFEQGTSKERILRLERRMDQLEALLSPLNLHEQAKTRLTEAIKKHRRFRSKRQWALYSRLGSMDTYYRLEKEAVDELARQGHKVIFEPVFRRKDKSHVQRFEVSLVT